MGWGMGVSNKGGEGGGERGGKKTLFSEPEERIWQPHHSVFEQSRHFIASQNKHTHPTSKYKFITMTNVTIIILSLFLPLSSSFPPLFQLSMQHAFGLIKAFQLLPSAVHLQFIPHMQFTVIAVRSSRKRGIFITAHNNHHVMYLYATHR